MNLETLQAEQAEWSARNFGPHEAWQPLLGMIEEVGELAHAHLATDNLLPRAALYAAHLAVYCGKIAHHVLKAHQGIRGAASEHGEGALDGAARLHMVLWGEVEASGKADEIRRRIAEIRNTDGDGPVLKRQTMAEREDALADVTVYAADYATSSGFNYGKTVAYVWAKVKQRDWAKDKALGVTATAAPQATR